MTALTVATRRVKVTGDLFHGVVPAGAIYMGRGMPGLAASPYANPFSVKRFGLVGSKARFRRWLWERPELVERACQELPGHDLACWCYLAAPWCHVDDWIEIVSQGATES